MITYTNPSRKGRGSAIRRQAGAVIVLVCLLLFFLLGVTGIAFDFGRLFIVKTELQTAMDACALAAAQELDEEPTALTRARSAGTTAGNLNRVNLQSANWDGKGQVVDADISFRDPSYAPTTVAANARYVQCQHTQAGVRMWLLHALGAFTGDTAANPSNRNVLASAVATRASAQSTCPIPVALKAKAGGTRANNFGFQIGEWVTVFDKSGAALGSGEMGWYNLDGSRSAQETAAELSEGGHCGTRLGDTLGTPGAQTSVDRPWNYRFGIYKNSDSPSLNHPDQSGYAYTSTNWKNTVPQNAFAGTPAAGSDPTAKNYIIKRTAYASYDDTGSDIRDGSKIVYGATNANMLNGFQKIATPAEHRQYGYSRRLAVVPVINDAAQVTDFVCMFMLNPLTGPNGTAQLEYRGLAGIPDSPCAPSGMPGGLAGPLVPVLVR
jgi:Flp pilus assembly protein TadG